MGWDIQVSIALWDLVLTAYILGHADKFWSILPIIRTEPEYLHPTNLTNWSESTLHNILRSNLGKAVLQLPITEAMEFWQLLHMIQENPITNLAVLHPFVDNGRLQFIPQLF